MNGSGLQQREQETGKPRIAWMPGDGIGPEVLAATRMVLDAVGFEAEYVPCELGWALWTSEGEPLPERTLETMRTTRCAMFGAITSKPAPEAMAELPEHLKKAGKKYRSPIVRLRQEFDLHTNVRPCRSLGRDASRWKGGAVNIGMDAVIVRENTEGLYAGVEFSPLPRDVFAALNKDGAMRRFAEVADDDIAVSLRVSTRAACERIVRSAFMLAEKTGRRKVTLSEKPNILRATGGLMTDVARQVAKEFPEIAFDEVNVDAACMLMVTNPERFEVIVAENMFGDILSDLGAGLTGGPGLAPAANIGDSYAVFEPTHGSAPDIAGKGLANPIAAILSAALMLEWLGDEPRKRRIEEAVARMLDEGKVGTRDMGLNSSTMEVAREIAKLVAATHI